MWISVCFQASPWSLLKCGSHTGVVYSMWGWLQVSIVWIRGDSTVHENVICIQYNTGSRREWNVSYIININKKLKQAQNWALRNSWDNMWAIRCCTIYFVSCQLGNYVARSWYRGPDPDPWVLKLTAGGVLDQMPFRSRKVLHQSHFPFHVFATSHGSCQSGQTKQTSLPLAIRYWVMFSKMVRYQHVKMPC